MRIKLGYPLLTRHVAELSHSFLLMSEDADCLQAITHLTTDSREVMPGDLFVALVTDRDDGHRYIEDAVTHGASAVLCCGARIQYAPNCCRLFCEDTTAALARMAKAYAATIPHVTVAITGSVGKTTTRRFVSSVLKEKYRVHESPHNYNNLLGNCLLLLSMPRDTDILVAECGMNAKGEIHALSTLLVPDYAVITNVGISHLAGLGSRDAIGNEKLAITDGMRSTATLLCSGDDDFLISHAPDDSIFISCRGDTYSYDICYEDLNGITFSFHTGNKTLEQLHIPTIGRHTLACASFAVMLGDMLGMDIAHIRYGLSHYRAEQMRQAYMQIGHTTIVLDAYNACPDSMRAACEVTLKYSRELNGGACALIGDMYELGSMTEHYHHEIGARFASSGYRHLYFWGNYASHYYHGALHAGYDSTKITLFEKNTDIESIACDIARQTIPRDVLLIKGSRGMKMERLIPYLKRYAEGTNL